MDAMEHRLSLATFLINGPALATSLRGVGRVDKDDGNAMQFSLVKNLLAQVVKRPAMQLAALLPSSPDPRTYALQVFKGNRSVRAFGFQHELFADAVVHVAGKTGLFAAALFKQAPGRLRTLALHSLSQAGMATAKVAQVSTGVLFPAAVIGNVGHTKVNAKNAFNVNWFRRFDFASGEQVKLPINVAKVAFALLGLQQFKLASASTERHVFATVQRPDRNGLCVRVPRKDAAIVSNRAVFPERAARVLIQAVSLNNLADTTHRHLGAQLKLVTDTVVDELVNTHLGERLGGPRRIANRVTCGVGTLERLKQCLVLFWRRFQLNFGRQFHRKFYYVSTN